MRRELVPDREIAAIADRQGGIVARAQLLDLGLGASAIDRRVRAGRMHPLHRGVYAVGHRVVGAVGRRWAAVLACGPGSALGYASSGAAWELRTTASAIVHVIVGPGGRLPRHGVRVHRAGPLPYDELTLLDGLPITTPARTLLDLAASGLDASALERALDRAEQLRLLDFDDLDVLLERHAGRRGIPALRRLRAGYRGPVDARSELERIVAGLCASHGIQLPQVNCVVAGKVRDFYWPRERLVVEADSYAWHRSPSALAADRERDAELMLAGIRTLRFTWEHATRRPDYVVDTIIRGLATS